MTKDSLRRVGASVLIFSSSRQRTRRNSGLVSLHFFFAHKKIAETMTNVAPKRFSQNGCPALLSVKRRLATHDRPRPPKKLSRPVQDRPRPLQDDPPLLDCGEGASLWRLLQRSWDGFRIFVYFWRPLGRVHRFGHSASRLSRHPQSY